MKLQKKSLVFLGLTCTLFQGASALESAKVISSTPVVEQINVPSQNCMNVPMAVQQPPSGAGAVLGAIAGGVVGSAVGQGAGNAAATALGVMGGAVIGNNLEASKTTVVPAQQCNTQYTLQSRVTHYNVVYEYAGKQYNVQMPSDPGPTLSIELTPANVGSTAPVGATMPAPGVATVLPSGTNYVQPAYGAAPVYVNPYPYPYAYPYYAPFPVGVSIGFGGYYGRGRWR